MPEKFRFEPAIKPQDDHRKVFEQSPRYYDLCRGTYEKFNRYLLMGQHIARDADGNPTGDPSILASNHFNNLDTPLLASVAHDEMLGRLEFLAKDDMYYPLEKAAQKRFDPDTELGKYALLIARGLDFVPRTNTQLGGGYPVDRDHPDMEGVSIWAEKLLKVKKRSLGIYPQGTRIKEDLEVIKRLKLGPALLAIQNEVELYPIGIWGDHNIDPREKHGEVPLVVNIGEPLNPNDYFDYDDKNNYEKDGSIKEIRGGRTAARMTKDLKTKMQDLLDEARETSGKL